ncbi:HAD family hydrolase [Aeromonas molluscorum]|uniref:HAD family hydrolase n=1 Tax=Aeromonas molluscorum TaxID=271417 RepID=UPI003F1A68AB
MMAIRLAIFDWDGTLMDSIGRIVTCVELAASDCGLPMPTQQQTQQIIGLSLGVGLAGLFGLEEGSESCDRLVDRYRYHYLHDNTPSPLFDGVTELLHDWHGRGVLLAVATGKSRRGLDRVLNETGLRPLFAASRGADEANSKPDPLMLRQLLDELKVPVNEAVMIGDSIHDLGMAKALGMASIAVTWGVHDKARLAEFEPVLMADTMAQLRGAFD